MFAARDKKIMASSDSRKINWHFEMLPSQTKQALDFLSQEKWLKNSGWYLAGGTALALQTGHRKSHDLDFFSEVKEFDNEKLLSNFSNNKNWDTELNKNNTIYGELLKAKVSFIAYPFFVPKQKFLQYENVKVLNQKDIAVMKITSISQRGRKRDFFDLYYCAKNIEPLEKIIKRLKVQYPSVAHNYHHILKALVYFEDAESDPEPEINFEADWRTVKNFFLQEITIIAKKLIR